VQCPECARDTLKDDLIFEEYGNSKKIGFTVSALVHFFLLAKDFNIDCQG
jgi:hypothetical protein